MQEEIHHKVSQLVSKTHYFCQIEKTVG